MLEMIIKLNPNDIDFLSSSCYGYEELCDKGNYAKYNKMLVQIGH